MQASSWAFETSIPQMVFFTVTCLVRAIALQATVRSYVTWRRSQSSPTVDAGGGNGRHRHALWPVATGQSAQSLPLHKICSRADTRGHAAREAGKPHGCLESLLDRCNGLAVELN